MFFRVLDSFYAGVPSAMLLACASIHGLTSLGRLLDGHLAEGAMGLVSAGCILGLGRALHVNGRQVSLEDPALARCDVRRHTVHPSQPLHVSQDIAGQWYLYDLITDTKIPLCVGDVLWVVSMPDHGHDAPKEVGHQEQDL